MNALLVVGVTSAALFAVALSFVVGYRLGHKAGWNAAARFYVPQIPWAQQIEQALRNLAGAMGKMSAQFYASVYKAPPR